MQYEVLISTAKVFLEDFYTTVAARKPVDWAVQSARKAISLQYSLDNREFATRCSICAPKMALFFKLTMWQNTYTAPGNYYFYRLVPVRSPHGAKA